MNKNKARPAVLSQGSFQLLEAHPEVSYMAAGGASHLQDAPSTCAARMWSGCPLPAYSIASTFNVCFQINCPVFATYILESGGLGEKGAVWKSGFGTHIWELHLGFQSCSAGAFAME